MSMSYIDEALSVLIAMLNPAETGASLSQTAPVLLPEGPAGPSRSPTALQAARLYLVSKLSLISFSPLRGHSGR